MSKVLDFLRANRIFYLATVKGDQPKLRPLGFVMEYEGKIFFGVGDQKEVFKQLQANPKAEISTTCAETGQWLRFTGRAVFDRRPELFEAAVKTMPMLKDIYGDPAGQKLACFYLAEAEAWLYDMKGGQEKLEA